MPEIKVKVIIMTYVDRFDLLKKTVESLTDDCIKEILLVDNGCSYDLAERAHEVFDKKLFEILKIYKINNPLGTSKTVNFIFEQDHTTFTHLLMLDDDNVLCGSLMDLKCKLMDSNNIINLIRYDREPYATYIHKKKDLKILGNAFMGFSILKFIRDSFKINKSKISKPAVETSYITSHFLPYGGTIIPTVVVKEVKVNQEFVLYHDDIDFFYRCYKSGFNTLITSICSVVDIDKSWHDVTSSLVGQASRKPINAFYAIRNKVYFEREVSNSIFVFTINKIIWLTYFNLKYYKERKSKGYTLVKRAIKDGINSKLGVFIQ